MTRPAKLRLNSKDNLGAVDGASSKQPTTQIDARTAFRSGGRFNPRPNPNMTNFIQHAWDSDCEAAVLSLTRDQINDHDFWFSTVEIIEAGYDPTTREPITLSALEAWVDRCKSSPTNEEPNHASTPRVIHPQN